VRLVQITIPSGKRETILAALDDEELDYVVSDETSGREFSAIAYVPVPANGVEPTLETLRSAGLDEDAYTVVLEANTVISRRFDKLQDRYDEEKDEDRIARAELVASAEDLAPSLRTYVTMTVISAMVATAGLLLDSPAVVVGSMVIAPLVGPALSASVGTVVDDKELFSRGIRLQILGIVVSIAAAFVFAFIVRHGNLVPPLSDVTVVPEIRERVAPDFLMLAIALGAGAAGIISLMSGVAVALVGVMIAVALIPPAATVGIGLAWGQPLVSFGAGVLVLVNILSVNLSALVALWYSGYRTEHWFREDEARRATIERVGALILGILLLSAFLGGVTLDSIQQATTEEQIQQEAQTVVDDFDTQHEIELLSVQVDYPRATPFQEPNRVIVTVGVPPGESVSGLAETMDRRVAARTNDDVETQVRYVQVERG